MTRITPGIVVWGTPTAQDVARLLVKHGYVLTGRTVRELLMDLEVTAPVEVALPHSKRRAATPWVRFHRTRNPRTGTWGGWRIELPSSAARHLSDAEAIELLNRTYARRKGLAALRREGGTLPHRCRALLAAAAVGADSPPERDLVAALERAGVHTRSNVQVGDYFWDIIVEGHNVLIEVDGYHFHRDATESQENFRRDRWKSNDATLRGYVVLRYAAGCVAQHIEDIIDHVLAAIRPGRRPGRWSQGVWRWHRFFQRRSGPVAPETFAF